MPISFDPPDSTLWKTASAGDSPAPTSVLQAAQVMQQQGRFAAACGLVARLVRERKLAPIEFRQALVFLEQCGRHDLAFDCVESRLAEVAPEPVDFVDSARLAVQLGHFDWARERYESALRAGVDPCQYKIAQGLAMCQRYAQDEHPDLALFKRWLHRPGLDNGARAGVLYALGKAHDDLGHYRDAADCWRRANAAMALQRHWSAGAWRQAIALTDGPWASVCKEAADSAPIFVVGMPRSGTTLVARLLAACPEVRDRGELMWIPQLFGQIVHAGTRQDPATMRKAADAYWRMVRQDDSPARWYVDKQPLNFLHLGLIAALFPQAQVVYCVRDPRDVALSIWTQCFSGQSAAFMHRFDDIATVMATSRMRVAYWKRHLSLPIHTVTYETLVAAPERVIDGLYSALGLPRPSGGTLKVAQASDAVVATASMWQVRQPISSRSVGRWRHYANFVPELGALFDATAGA